MAAKLGGGQDEAITDINVTPLVDIMLVLLIIFMLTSETVSRKVKKPTIDVDLPTAASGQDKPGEPLNVVILQDGALFLNGSPITLPELQGRVRARVAGLPKGAKSEAVVSADRRVNHGTVVRVIDAMRVLGIENVAINTKEQEIQ